VKTAASKKVKLVVGTTGFSDSQRKEMLDAIRASKVTAVIAPNMSVGVNIFFKMIGELAGLLKNYDVEVIEAHHRFKRDAPSGTAAKAAQILAESRNKDIKNIGVYGRQGECPRNEGEIGIHAIRAGDITGDHTILFAGTGERIEFTHRAHSRDAFAQGVPLAIRYVMSAKPGAYDMQDVLGLK
jgi:4-hydroxy-tetrahydrodipicolinate reductase